MNQDEIIEMAKQAGFEEQFTRPQDAIVRKGFALSGEFKGYKANNAALETFAKLVAEKAFKDGYAIGEAAGFKEGVKLERKAWCEA